MDWKFLDNIFRDGVRISRYYLDLPSGETIRVLVGNEPAGAMDKLLWHASASIGIKFNKGTSRRPSDGELVLVRKFLFNQLPGVVFEEGKNEGTNKHVRHLWEE